MDVGNRINELLFENHMKQKDLAEALNVTEVSMSRWVKGTRIPKSETLCAIADYFDVSADWLLGRSEYRNYNGFISGDDALEYCRKAKEAAWGCWHEVAHYSVREQPVSKIAENVQACAYFEREILRWEYDIPRMIHSLADGTRKESFEDEPQTDLANDSQVLVKDLVDDEFNPYDEECMRCKHLKLKCEFIPTYCKFEPRDEPQTERSE